MQTKKSGSPNYKIIFRSESQEHYFNCPYQVGTHGDDPSKATEHQIDIKLGDLVILGTDGVFDNLYDFQILQLTEQQLLNKQFNPKEFSDNLAKKAFDLSLDKNYLSPFCNNKYKQENSPCLGGKSDDISVALGLIQFSD
jgi:protein phosphatase PTC7